MQNGEPNSEIIIYEGDGGQPNIEVRVEGDTVWLTQAQLVELFDSSKANVSTLLLKGCHKKQEIVGNRFRMFGLGS